MKKVITVLIPAYNEEGNLERLMEQLTLLSENRLDCVDLDKETGEITGNCLPDMRDYDWEFLFVNDGSRDNTLARLRRLREADERVSIVNLSRNFGKEAAMLAGFDHAVGDAVVILDADLQDPVNLIPNMIFWWEQGYDDVYGERRSRGKESWLRKRLSLTYYSLLQNMTKIEVLPNVGDFRLLSKRAIASMRKLRETQRYTKGMFCWIGYPKKSILFDRHDRNEGKSSFNYKSLFLLAIEGITSFTTAPLRISAIGGGCNILAINALCFLDFV